jgi:phytoene dehydrogenase-like protein
MEGWMLTTDRPEALMGQGMDQTLPGLESFYMAGQWVQPGGGVPTASWSARKALKRICKEDRRRFVTTVVGGEAEV